MMRRGKLKLRAEQARDRGVLDRIFERCLEAKL